MATQKPFRRSWGGWFGLLTMIAGLWFLISPWVLGFGATNTAGLNAIVVGLLIAVCGALDAFGIGYLPVRAMRVFGVFAAILGLWAIVAPFVLNIDGIARWDAVVTGVVTVLVSGYDAWKLPSFAQASHA
jgi:SPW repeat